MDNAWEKIYKEGKLINSKPHSEIKRISRLFSKNNFKRILDLGCGAGRNLVYLSERGFDLYGLDSSAAGLILTIGELNKKRLSAHLIIHDMKSLPYDNEYFDVVISIQVIHHNKLKDIKTTISEITRVLKKEGIIWITMPVSQNESSTKQEEMEPGTFLPLNGPEKGLPHHYFKKLEILQIFINFSIIDLHIDKANHYSLLARKVKK
jgi:ubiquinone/menaquinone biosynthesis C-methylase UbiE